MDSRKCQFPIDPEPSMNSQSIDAGGSSTQLISVAGRLLTARQQVIYDVGVSQGREAASFKRLGFRTTPASYPRWYALGFAHGRQAALAGVKNSGSMLPDVPEEYSVGFKHGNEEFSDPEYATIATNTT